MATAPSAEEFAPDPRGTGTAPIKPKPKPKPRPVVEPAPAALNQYDTPTTPAPPKGFDPTLADRIIQSSLRTKQIFSDSVAPSAVYHLPDTLTYTGVVKTDEVTTAVTSDVTAFFAQIYGNDYMGQLVAAQSLPEPQRSRTIAAMQSLAGMNPTVTMGQVRIPGQVTSGMSDPHELIQQALSDPSSVQDMNTEDQIQVRSVASELVGTLQELPDTGISGDLRKAIAIGTSGNVRLALSQQDIQTLDQVVSQLSGLKIGGTTKEIAYAPGRDVGIEQIRQLGEGTIVLDLEDAKADPARAFAVRTYIEQNYPELEIQYGREGIVGSLIDKISIPLDYVTAPLGAGLRQVSEVTDRARTPAERKAWLAKADQIEQAIQTDNETAYNAISQELAPVFDLAGGVDPNKDETWKEQASRAVIQLRDYGTEDVGFREFADQTVENTRPQQIGFGFADSFTKATDTLPGDSWYGAAYMSSGLLAAIVLDPLNWGPGLIGGIKAARLIPKLDAAKVATTLEDTANLLRENSVVYKLATGAGEAEKVYTLTEDAARGTAKAMLKGSITEDAWYPLVGRGWVKNAAYRRLAQFPEEIAASRPFVKAAERLAHLKDAVGEEQMFAAISRWSGETFRHGGGSETAKLLSQAVGEDDMGVSMLRAIMGLDNPGVPLDRLVGELEDVTAQLGRDAALEAVPPLPGGVTPAGTLAVEGGQLLPAVPRLSAEERAALVARRAHLEDVIKGRDYVRPMPQIFSMKQLRQIERYADAPSSVWNTVWDATIGFTEKFPGNLIRWTERADTTEGVREYARQAMISFDNMYKPTGAGEVIALPHVAGRLTGLRMPGGIIAENAIEDSFNHLSNIGRVLGLSDRRINELMGGWSGLIDNPSAARGYDFLRDTWQTMIDESPRLPAFGKRELSTMWQGHTSERSPSWLTIDDLDGNHAGPVVYREVVDPATGQVTRIGKPAIEADQLTTWRTPSIERLREYMSMTQSTMQRWSKAGFSRRFVAGTHYQVTHAWAAVNNFWRTSVLGFRLFGGLPARIFNEQMLRIAAYDYASAVWHPLEWWYSTKVGAGMESAGFTQLFREHPGSALGVMVDSLEKHPGFAQVRATRNTVEMGDGAMFYRAYSERLSRYYSSPSTHQWHMKYRPFGDEIGPPVPPPGLEQTRVLDEAGQPLRVFHGSNEAFEQFDMGKLRGYEPGIFFAEEAEIAGAYSTGGSPQLWRSVSSVEKRQRIAEVLRDSYFYPSAADVTRRKPYEAAIQKFLETGKMTDLDYLPIRETNRAFSAALAVDYKGAPNVHFSYLDIRNPLDEAAPITLEQANAVIEQAHSQGVISRGVADDILGDIARKTQPPEPISPGAAELAAQYGPEDIAHLTEAEMLTYGTTQLNGADLWRSVDDYVKDGKMLREVFQAGGYDGIRHIGTGDKAVWIAFDPSQVHLGAPIAADPVAASLETMRGHINGTDWLRTYDEYGMDPYKAVGRTQQEIAQLIGEGEGAEYIRTLLRRGEVSIDDKLYRVGTSDLAEKLEDLKDSGRWTPGARYFNRSAGDYLPLQREGPARAFSDKLFKTFYTAPDLALSRAPMYRQMAAREFQNLIARGYPAERAMRLANAAAARGTAEMMFTIGAKTSGEVFLRNINPFFPAYRELATTWLKRIPLRIGEGHWALGSAAVVRRADIWMDFFKQLGVVQTDSSGQQVIPLPFLAPVVRFFTGVDANFKISAPISSFAGILPVPIGFNDRDEQGNLLPLAERVKGIFPTLGGPSTLLLAGLKALFPGKATDMAEDFLTLYGTDASLGPTAVDRILEAFNLPTPWMSGTTMRFHDTQRTWAVIDGMRMSWPEMIKENGPPPAFDTDPKEAQAWAEEWLRRGEFYAQQSYLLRGITSMTLPFSITIEDEGKQEIATMWSFLNSLPQNDDGKFKSAYIRSMLAAYPNLQPYMTGKTLDTRLADDPSSTLDEFMQAVADGEVKPRSAQDWAVFAVGSNVMSHFQARRNEIYANAGTPAEFQVDMEAQAELDQIDREESWYLDYTVGDLNWLPGQTQSFKDMWQVWQHYNEVRDGKTTPRLSVEQKTIYDISQLEGEFAKYFSSNPETSDEYYKMKDQIYELLDYQPTTEGGQARNWYFSDVQSGYYDKLDKLYKPGMTAADYQKVRDLANKYNHPFVNADHPEWGEFPSPEEYSFAKLDPKGQEREVANWATLPGYFLTEFQREQVGYTIDPKKQDAANELANFVTENEIEFDAAVDKYNISTGSEAYDINRAKYDKAYADKAQNLGLENYWREQNAPEYIRVGKALNLGEQTQTWGLATKRVQELTHRVETTPYDQPPYTQFYSASGSSDVAEKARAQMNSDVRQWRKNDSEFDRIISELQVWMGDEGQPLTQDELVDVLFFDVWQG